MYDVSFMKSVAAQLVELEKAKLDKEGKSLSWEVAQVIMNMSMNYEQVQGNCVVYVHGDLEKSFNQIHHVKNNLIDFSDKEDRHDLIKWLDKVFSSTHDLGAISLSNFGDEGGIRVVVQLVKKPDISERIGGIYYLSESDPDHLLLMPKNPDSCIMMTCE